MVLLATPSGVQKKEGVRPKKGEVGSGVSHKNHEKEGCGGETLFGQGKAM